VVTEMSDVLCLNVDAESEAGSKLAKEFGVRGFPTLLFLNPNGSPRDSIVGYMPEEDFLAEVRRIESGEGTIVDLEQRIAAGGDVLGLRFDLIEKLGEFNAQDAIAVQREAVTATVVAGQGFEASSIDSRWALTKRLRKAGLGELAEAQIAAIRKLDPEGRSLALRWVAFEALRKDVSGPEDLPKIQAFLAEETYGEILFDGWYLIYSFHDRAARTTRDEEEKRAARTRVREAAPRLWRHVPERYQASLGNSIAWGFYEDAEVLDATEKAFALEVAVAAAKASDDDVNVIDTLACCLFINGKVKEALVEVQRCIELDPENPEWRKRREEFTTTSG